MRSRGVTALLSSTTVVAVFTVLAVLTVLLSGCTRDEGAGTRVGADESASGSVLPAERDPVVADIDRCPQAKPFRRAVQGLPDVELPCLGPGDPVQLADLSGRPMLVNVWASWCEPCRDEMPWLQEAHDTGLTVIGVDAQDQSAAASALLNELGVTYPSVFDPDNKFAAEVGVITKPMTLFVAEDGDVKHVNLGPFESQEQMNQLVQQYLGVELK